MTKYAPLFLSSTVEFTASQEGTSAVPDLAKLQNPFRQGMWIDDVHFLVKAQFTPEGGDQSIPCNYGGRLTCRFKLGGLDLSTKHVPIWNYGIVLQDALGTSWRNVVPEVTIGGDVGDNSATYWNTFRWLLPKPLYVPAGSVLAPNFILNATPISSTSIKVYVGYSCRRALEPERPPDHLDVPFVGYFESPLVTARGDYVDAISGATDLFNPFQVPLHVQRFVGRVLGEASAFPTWPWMGETLPMADGVSEADPAYFPHQNRVMLTDSKGYNIIRDPMPWLSVFDPNRRAWTFVRDLAPKEWYRLQLTRLADPLVLEDRTFMVSMVGYRKEAV